MESMIPWHFTVKHTEESVWADFKNSANMHLPIGKKTILLSFRQQLLLYHCRGVQLQYALANILILEQEGQLLRQRIQ
jgi:hypothetical protein